MIRRLIWGLALGCSNAKEKEPPPPPVAPAVTPDAAVVARKPPVRLRVTPADDDTQPPEITVDTSPARRGAIGETEDTTIYTVVVNHEEQYSIWPADRGLPLGWTAVGKPGPKAECLAYIKEVWTDMRPANLRKRQEPTPADESAQ